MKPPPGEALDLGPVFVGQRATEEVQLLNAGTASLRVSAVQVTDPRFETSFSDALVIEPGSTADLVVHFAPPLDTEVSAFGATPFEGELRIEADDALPPDDEATVSLRGAAVSGACEVPARLEFGRIEVGAEARQTITLRNPAVVPVEVTTERITSERGQQALFGQPPGTPSGQIALGAGASVELVFTFRPTEAVAASAQVRVRAAAQCPWVDVVLTGEGARDVLAWGPTALDFGFVAVGTSTSAPVQFDNASSTPVEVRTSATGDVSVSPATLSVAAKGSATVQVTFTPTRPGARAGSVRFSTSARLQPEGVVPWTGNGGGPRARVSPRPLAFGVVPFLAGATAPLARRRLFVESIGTGGTDPRAALVVTSAEADGAPQLTLQGPTSIPPLRAGERAEFAVTLLPTQPGAGAANVRVVTNDPSTPEVTVPVSWTAVSTPECDLTVGPARLAFGLVSMPHRRELRALVVNTSLAPCAITSIDLAPGTDRDFTLVRGPQQSVTLAPGAQLEVAVAFSPTRQGSGLERRTGQLQVLVPSRTSPLKAVDLDALAGSACLVALPDSVDFGTVPVGCRSAERQLQLFNVCATPVQLDRISVEACSTSPCPFVTGVNTLPAILASNDSLAVSMRAAPSTAGVATANLVVLAAGVTPVEVVVPLRLSAGAQMVHEDSTLLPSTPQVDLLLVIDDSCSMAAKQSALRANFQALFAATQRSATSFHFGVTTTDIDQGPAGRLIGDPSNPVVLNETTPNLAALFQQKVQVGIRGSSFEHGLAAAARALSPELLQTTNAGFLRSEARLAVLFVTDANEQSEGPWERWAAELFAVKGAGRPEAFTAHGFVNLNRAGTAGHFESPAPCRHDGPPDDAHPWATRRYSRLIERTGGERADICLIDWAPILSRISGRTFAVQSSFPLTSAPDASSSVVVLVDGRSVPSLQGNAVVWRYLPESNSVRFEEPFLPTPGQRVTVRYQVVCQ
ncbi:MAG: choice-of-anchor D domain-containing protein [Myxococcaceae bacterium]|nr:choice-of-anchor D domain-containing protein [Myxococcaceae bacterium]